MRISSGDLAASRDAQSATNASKSAAGTTRLTMPMRSASSALIYRNVGRKKTNELLLLGDRIDAAEAERIGIVNRVVSGDAFDAAVRDWAQRLAAKSPVLLRLGKDAMFRQQDMAFADALEFLHAQLTIAFSTDDIQEGVKAFFEKRDPVWTGR